MSVTSASNLCFLSGHPLISIRTNVHNVRRLWLVTDIHAYIVDFHADIADVCADIAENHVDVRNFSQCPLHVRRASANIWDTGCLPLPQGCIHVHNHYFQTSSPLKPQGPSSPNFMWSILGKGE